MAAPRYDNIFANTTARRPGFVEVEMDVHREGALIR